MSSSRLCRRGTRRRCEKVPRWITPLSLNTFERGKVDAQWRRGALRSRIDRVAFGGGDGWGWRIDCGGSCPQPHNSRIDATTDQSALIEKSAVASTVDGPRGGWGV